MSMMIQPIDPGFSVSVVTLGGASQPRWGFTRVPMAVELPELPVAEIPQARMDALAAPSDDDCERWDGLS